MSLDVEITDGIRAGGFLNDMNLSPASEILPNLWMGGCPQPSMKLPEDFGFVLSLYPWGRWQIGPETNRLEVRLFDGQDLPDQKLLYALATIVNQQREEYPVYVHCQAGLNRSGLVTGLSLIESGMSPSGAIDLLRTSRSKYVLCNPVFEQWLLGLN